MPPSRGVQQPASLVGAVSVAQQPTHVKVVGMRQRGTQSLSVCSLERQRGARLLPDRNPKGERGRDGSAAKANMFGGEGVDGVNQDGTEACKNEYRKTVRFARRQLEKNCRR